MTAIATTIVDTFLLGTLTGDHFLVLQMIFQNARGDMGATAQRDIPAKSLQVLFDRGFIKAHYNYKGHFDGYVPTDRADQCLTLEDAHGCQMVEPRNAYDARLVVLVPEWIDAPNGLGKSIRA